MTCPKCGTPLDAYGNCPVCDRNSGQIRESDLPEKFKPLSPWNYFWLSILFSVPVVGFIFLIVFSFNDDNINRRNFARSYWCALLIAVIIGVVVGIFCAILGVGFLSALSNY